MGDRTNYRTPGEGPHVLHVHSFLKEGSQFERDTWHFKSSMDWINLWLVAHNIVKGNATEHSSYSSIIFFFLQNSEFQTLRTVRSHSSSGWCSHSKYVRSEEATCNVKPFPWVLLSLCLSSECFCVQRDWNITCLATGKYYSLIVSLVLSLW